MTIALDSTNNSELVARLEEAALNGLPTLQTEFYDGWIVRMSEGYSRRGVTPFWWTGLDLRFLDVGTISFRS